METAVDMLHSLFSKIWEEEEVPAQWKEGIIMKLPKKGDLRNFSKVLNRALLERMKEAVDPKLRIMGRIRSIRLCKLTKFGHHLFFNTLTGVAVSMETLRNARAWPQQCWEICANGTNVVALRLGDHRTKEMLGVVGSKVWPVSNFIPNDTQQHATGCANGRDNSFQSNFINGKAINHIYTC